MQEPERVERLRELARRGRFRPATVARGDGDHAREREREIEEAVAARRVSPMRELRRYGHCRGRRGAGTDHTAYATEQGDEVH